MKKWKRVIAVAFALVLIVSGTAFASGSVQEKTNVYDFADLFDDAEEMELASAIYVLQKKMDMGVAVVTTEENPGSAREFADDCFEIYEIGYGDKHSGALFLIDMYNGELWISTEGDMIRYLTDDRIDAMLDDVIEYAYDEDFYGCAVGFLGELEQYYEDGIESGQYNYDTETGKISRYRSIRWYEFLIAFAIAAIVAGGTVLAIVRDYNMEDEAERISANFKLSYRKDSGFALSDVLVDAFLRSYVTRTVIRTQSNNRTGGSGSSSAGRSSTHRSSSGRVHGGGGRSFRK